MRKLRTGLLVLAAALVGATALSTPAIAAPAVTPNAILPTGAHGHTCTVLGDDTNLPGAVPSQGVICIDLAVINQPDGTTKVFGIGTGFCQTVPVPPSTRVQAEQCANVAMWVGYEWIDANGVHANADLGQCGHSFGPCPVPRPGFTNAADASRVLSVPPGRCVAAHGRIWSHLENGPTTAVQLPGSDHFVTLPNIAATWDTAWFNVGTGC